MGPKISITQVLNAKLWREFSRSAQVMEINVIHELSPILFFSIEIMEELDQRVSRMDERIEWYNKPIPALSIL